MEAGQVMSAMRTGCFMSAPWSVLEGRSGRQ